MEELTIISKDEGSIDTGKFRRHDDDKYAQVSCEDLALWEQGNLEKKRWVDISPTLRNFDLD